jgi:hypothetical protein
MRTTTALWEKLRVARAAIAIRASHSTQLKRLIAVPIVSLHHYALSAVERVRPGEALYHLWGKPVEGS